MCVECDDVCVWSVMVCVCVECDSVCVCVWSVMCVFVDCDGLCCGTIEFQLSLSVTKNSNFNKSKINE